MDNLSNLLQHYNNLRSTGKCCWLSGGYSIACVAEYGHWSQLSTPFDFKFLSSLLTIWTFIIRKVTIYSSSMLGKCPNVFTTPLIQILPMVKQIKVQQFAYIIYDIFSRKQQLCWMLKMWLNYHLIIQLWFGFKKRDTVFFQISQEY